MTEYIIHEETVTEEGWFGTSCTFVRTRIEVVGEATSIPNTKPRSPLQPVRIHSMHRWLNAKYVSTYVYIRYFDLTWLHVPSSFASILRWLEPPTPRQPTAYEMHEAERDRIEFSDERTLKEKLSAVHALYS